MDGVVYAVGCLAYLIFFAADFFTAFTLNALKQDHPSIDALAAGTEDATGDDADPDELLHTRDDSSAPSSPAVAYATTFARTVLGTSFSFRRSATQTRRRRVHLVVLAAAFGAPFFAALQIVAPSAMGWSMFGVPTWLSFLTIVPALCCALMYALRAARLGQLGAVTKSQWLAAMWFRLDVVCVMAVAMLMAWGDWLVALCLFGVDLYLAQRLLATERRLVATSEGSTLLQDEVDGRAEVGMPADHGSTAANNVRR
jgi:hypothetical protein